MDQLGQGASVTVHLARQVALDREVVIKRIVGGASSHDPETALRFERQARLLATLDHPGIVRVHEVVRVGSDLFVVMEHVPGADLRELLAAGPLPPDEAARILGEIAAALDHAHERGVVHGDLQPANVLLDGAGAVRVSDFGLAALLKGQARSQAGRAGEVGGLAYVAPELARGDVEVDRRADVYSLGVIAYEMLVGRVPFPVDPGDPYATVRAQMEEPPPRPSGLVPGFPPLLQAALLWALEKPPERRPATAGELVASLRDGLTLSPTIGVYGRRRVRVPAADAVTAAAVSGGRDVSRSRRRRRVAIGAAAGVVVAAIAVAAGVRYLTAPAPPPPLAVTAITAAADPADGVGHCPAARVTVHAIVTTNGAPGAITYEWLLPNGRASAQDRVTLRGGARTTAVDLPVAYSGGAPAQGVAALHVLSPAAVYSQPVRVAYACP
jgi:serine/threonine-protein kinase